MKLHGPPWIPNEYLHEKPLLLKESISLSQERGKLGMRQFTAVSQMLLWKCPKTAIHGRRGQFMP
jgi:hypothetical protein